MDVIEDTWTVGRGPWTVGSLNDYPQLQLGDAHRKG